MTECNCICGCTDPVAPASTDYGLCWQCSWKDIRGYDGHGEKPDPEPKQEEKESGG